MGSEEKVQKEVQDSKEEEDLEQFLANKNNPHFEEMIKNWAL